MRIYVLLLLTATACGDSNDAVDASIAVDASTVDASIFDADVPDGPSAVDAVPDARPDSGTLSCQDEVPACTTAIDLGTVTADAHVDPTPFPSIIDYDAWDSAWYKVRLAETIVSGSDPLQAHIIVTMAPDADYDITVYCLACGGTLASLGTEATGGNGNEFEYSFVRRNDVTGDQSFDVLIEVAHMNDICGYTLRVQGNQPVDVANCSSN
jgi:hypothetical protein